MISYVSSFKPSCTTLPYPATSFCVRCRGNCQKVSPRPLTKNCLFEVSVRRKRHFRPTTSDSEAGTRREMLRPATHFRPGTCGPRTSQRDVIQAATSSRRANATRWTDQQPLHQHGNWRPPARCSRQISEVVVRIREVAIVAPLAPVVVDRPAFAFLPVARVEPSSAVRTLLSEVVVVEFVSIRFDATSWILRVYGGHGISFRDILIFG